MTGIGFGQALDRTPLTIAGGRASEADVFGAAIDQKLLVDNTNAAYDALERAYQERSRAVKAATGVDLGNPLAPDLGPPTQIGPLSFGPANLPLRQTMEMVSRQRQAYQDQLFKLAAEFPQHSDVIKATTPIEKDAEQLAHAADDRLSAMMASNPSWSTTIAAIAGGMAGSLRDPLTIGTLAMGGGPGAAKTIFGRILTVAFKEALFNGATTAAAQPFVQSWREKAGLPAGFDEAAANVVAAAGLGGVLGGLGHGIGEGIAALGRRAATRRAIEEFALSQPTLGDQARRALKGDTSAAAAALAPIRDFMPPAVRGAIDAAEEQAVRDAQRQAELAHLTARRADLLQARADEAARLNALPTPLSIEDTPRINRLVNSLAPRAESIADRAGVLADRPDFGHLVDELRGRVAPEAAAPRRPLASLVKRLGGVNPQGATGRELKAIGLDSRNTPGPFSTRGRGDLDNIPFDEVPPELRPVLRADGNGYVDRQSLIDGLEAEIRSAPDALPGQDIEELRTHLHDNGIDPEALTDDELKLALGNLDDVEKRFLAAEPNGLGLSTDERAILPAGVGRRAYTADVVRQIFGRAGEGIPDDVVRAAADMHLFEGEPIEDAIDFALSDAAGVRRTLPPEAPELAGIPSDPPELVKDAPVDGPEGEEGAIDWDALEAAGVPTGEFRSEIEETRWLESVVSACKA